MRCTGLAKPCRSNQVSQNTTRFSLIHPLYFIKLYLRSIVSSHKASLKTLCWHDLQKMTNSKLVASSKCLVTCLPLFCQRPCRLVGMQFLWSCPCPWAGPKGLEESTGACTPKSANCNIVLWPTFSLNMFDCDVLNVLYWLKSYSDSRL